MISFKTFVVFSAFLPAFLGSSATAFAADPTGDPNAAIRKTNPGERALAEFERVKKINSELEIEHFTGLIKKDPKDAAAYAKRGKAYSALRDYTSALKDYEQAIQLDPKHTDAYIGRAVARFMQKDYDGSWQDVHKVESLGGEFWPSFMDALKKSSGREK